MGKWVNGAGWMRDYVPPKIHKDEKNNKEEPEKEKMPLAEITQEQPQIGVEYYPIRCPRCKSKKNKCYASRLPVRYHKCDDCNFCFKSIEVE